MSSHFGETFESYTLGLTFSGDAEERGGLARSGAGAAIVGDPSATAPCSPAGHVPLEQVEQTGGRSTKATSACR
jgi:hypothetical protein